MEKDWRDAYPVGSECEVNTYAHPHPWERAVVTGRERGGLLALAFSNGAPCSRAFSEEVRPIATAHTVADPGARFSGFRDWIPDSEVKREPAIGAVYRHRDTGDTWSPVSDHSARRVYLYGTALGPTRHTVPYERSLFAGDEWILLTPAPDPLCQHSEPEEVVDVPMQRASAQARAVKDSSMSQAAKMAVLQQMVEAGYVTSKAEALAFLAGEPIPRRVEAHPACPCCTLPLHRAAEVWRCADCRWTGSEEARARAAEPARPEPRFRVGDRLRSSEESIQLICRGDRTPQNIHRSVVFQVMGCDEDTYHLASEDKSVRWSGWAVESKLEPA